MMIMTTIRMTVILFFSWRGRGERGISLSSLLEALFVHLVFCFIITIIIRIFPKEYYHHYYVSPPAIHSLSFSPARAGLSSYAEDPVSGAKSLLPLLESAARRVPSEYSSATKISLRATAGLRMLPGDQADNLLAEVLKLFAQFPFKFSQDSVSIMDGADEGAFAWVTVNYLLGNLGKSEQETVGVIDLGGGSTQVTERGKTRRRRSTFEGLIEKRMNE